VYPADVCLQGKVRPQKKLVPERLCFAVCEFMFSSKEKICALYFKIQGTYFEIQGTYFWLPPNPHG